MQALAPWEKTRIALSACASVFTFRMKGRRRGLEVHVYLLSSKRPGIKNRDVTSDELEERTLEVACKSLALKNTDTVVKYTT